MTESGVTCECSACSADCFFGFHTWGKWATIEQGQTLSTRDALGLPPTKPTVVGIYEYQRRTCNHCGKSQLRETGA